MLSLMMKNNARKCGSTKKRIKHLIITATWLLWTLWLTGQLFRDYTLPTSLLFYIPSPVVFVCMSACGYYAWCNHTRHMARALAIFAFVPAVFVLGVENRFGKENERSFAGDTLRLVHWNVFSGQTGWEGLVDDIQRCVPDVCVLSEIPEETDIQSMALSLGQDYSGIRFSNLAVVARGFLQDGTWLQDHDGVKAYGVIWHSLQGMCRVLVVDLEATVLLAREPRLLAVRKLMIEWDADIVVGDFNAPRRSRALSPLPSGFVHAYEVVDSGWSYTWPVPCPVYAIDQCILGQRISPVSYDLESSWRSDHKRQLLEFTIDHRVRSVAVEEG